jgi:sensor histidine kinase regulating citrate/malate metabolism
VSRFTSLIKAQKIPLLPTVVFVMIFLCQYAIVGLVWENTECGLHPGNLFRRVSVREAEADNMFNGVPFGSINDEMSFLVVL